MELNEKILSTFSDYLFPQILFLLPEATTVPRQNASLRPHSALPTCVENKGGDGKPRAHCTAAGARASLCKNSEKGHLF